MATKRKIAFVWLPPETASVLDLLSKDEAPIEVAALAKSLGYTDKAAHAPLGEYLSELALRGQCFAWPGKRKGTLAFWNRSHEEIAGQMALRLSGEAAISRKQLLTLLKKAKVTGTDRVLAKLEKEGRLVEFAPLGLKLKLGMLNTEQPEPYLAPLRDIAARLIEAGVARELIQIHPEAPAGRILAALRKAEPQARAHYSVTKLRDNESLRNIPGSDFDKACFELWAEGKISLHYHDAPQFLSEEERRQMVMDDDGVYYIAISWKRP